MRVLLLEPLSSSQVGHFQKLLWRKDPAVCDRPSARGPLLAYIQLPRSFTKTRGMTGSSVLPIVYRIVKFLKLSRKKRV